MQSSSKRTDSSSQTGTARTVTIAYCAYGGGSRSSETKPCRARCEAKARPIAATTVSASRNKSGRRCAGAPSSTTFFTDLHEQTLGIDQGRRPSFGHPLKHGPRELGHRHEDAAAAGEQSGGQRRSI